MYHFYLRDTGFKALAAMGAAGTVDLALKLAFDRQFPFKPGSTGKCWGGGRACRSGHSATSFAFAAVVAHRYPKNKWVKGGAYALATGVSLSRLSFAKTPTAFRINRIACCPGPKTSSEKKPCRLSLAAVTLLRKSFWRGAKRMRPSSNVTTQHNLHIFGLKHLPPTSHFLNLPPVHPPHAHKTS